MSTLSIQCFFIFFYILQNFFDMCTTYLLLKKKWPQFSWYTYYSVMYFSVHLEKLEIKCLKPENSGLISKGNIAEYNFYLFTWNLPKCKDNNRNICLNFWLFLLVALQRSVTTLELLWVLSGVQLLLKGRCWHASSAKKNKRWN